MVWYSTEWYSMASKVWYGTILYGIVQYDIGSIYSIVWYSNRDLKIAVYGKRLTSRNFFVIKSKSWTVKCLSYTIYYRNLKRCFKTLCMTTKTLSPMGISLGHPSLDVRVDIWHLQWTAMSLSSRSIVKCKRQMAQVKRQAMWAENHLISTAKFL